MSSKKGFVFTVDAFVALTLVVLVIFVIVYQLNIPSAFFPQQSQTYNYARDVVSTLGTLTVSEAKQTGQSPTLLALAWYGNPETSDPFDLITTEEDHTVLEQIAKEALTPGREEVARLIATDFLTTYGSSPLLPEQFGANIIVDPGGQNIIIPIRDKPFTKLQSSASYVMLGYLESRNPGQSRYDYPLDNPDAQYCGGGEGARPCVDPPIESRYEEGTLMDATIVRVSVWT